MLELFVHLRAATEALEEYASREDVLQYIAKRTFKVWLHMYIYVFFLYMHRYTYILTYKRRVALQAVGFLLYAFSRGIVYSFLVFLHLSPYRCSNQEMVASFVFLYVSFLFIFDHIFVSVHYLFFLCRD